MSTKKPIPGSREWSRRRRSQRLGSVLLWAGLCVVAFSVAVAVALA